MLGRKKKRQSSISSVDSSLHPPQDGAAPSSRFTSPFNFLVERARGFRGVERTRTMSDDGTNGGGAPAAGKELSSSPTGSVRTFLSSRGGEGKGILSSASMQDITALPKGSSGSGGAFFRRTAVASNPPRPGWLSMNKPERAVGVTSPLNASPSFTMEPLPSFPGMDEGVGVGFGGVYLDAASQRGAASSTSDLASVNSQLTSSTKKKSFSRSVEDVSRVHRPSKSTETTPPVPQLTFASTEALNRDFRMNAEDNVRRASPSPIASTSAPSSRSRTPSASPQRVKQLAATRREAVPFPTSVSTPNFSSPIPAPSSPNASIGDRKRDSQTILCQGFLQRKGDYAPPPTLPSTSAPPLSIPSHLRSHSHSQSLSQSLTQSLTQSHAGPSAPQLRSTKSEVDLQRGWKPYRAALKGSKLYLHKLPGDLSATAKQLFPTGIVVGATDTEPIEEGGRKKQRAFWGTGGTSHPGLLVAVDATRKGKGKVVGGTLEALVHELIFATTFVGTKDGDRDEGVPSIPTLEDLDPETPYDTFLETLLLVWPFLPFSPSQSASELDRCSGLAIRTALEAMRKDPEESKASTSALGERLEKIVRIICDKYPEGLMRREGKVTEWRMVVGELVKQLSTLPVEEGGDVEERRKSLADLLEKASSKSPAVQVAGLTEWTSDVARPTFGRAGSSSSAGSGASPTKSKKRLPLEPGLTTTMSAQTFLSLDPALFAAQIHIFHLDRLGAITTFVSTSRHILRTAAIMLVTDPNSNQSAITSLFSFSTSKPHFLTRLVLQTILPAHTYSSASNLLSLNANSARDVRAMVITRWIDIGEDLRARGDTAGWAAIAIALSSRAVARLEETWRSMHRDTVQIVRQQWVRILVGISFADLEDASIGALEFGAAKSGTAIPFLGSILNDAATALKLAMTASEEHPGAVDFVPLYRLRSKLRNVEQVWIQSRSTPLDDRPDRELQHLLQCLSRMAQPTKSSLASFLPVSFEAEPRFVGHHLDSIFKPRSVGEPSPLIPLINVEPLPHITLVDRTKILASAARAIPKKQSITSMASVMPASNPSPDPYASRAMPTRLARHNSYPPSSPKLSTEKIGNFARMRREMSDPSDTLLRFAEGDIIFRIISTALPPMRPFGAVERGILSRTSSWIESRSSRVISRSPRVSGYSNFGSPSPLSRTPSRRDASPGPGLPVSASDSAGLKLQVAGEEEPVHVVVKGGTIGALVDLLIIGIDSFKTPTTDADGEASLTGRRPLQIDMQEYRASFFATFRTFVSPLTLLDMLRKRYIAAPNASKDYVGLSSTKPFPEWSMAPISDATEVDWDAVGSMRRAMLESLQFWMSNHIGDFLDDEDLFVSASTFLTFIESEERDAYELRSEDERSLEQAVELRKRFARDTLRPSVQFKKSMPSLNKGVKPLSFDDLSVVELVDRLDSVACAITRDVTESDVLKYLEFLEGSTLMNPTAWYPSRQLGKVDDEDLIIADPYSHLQAVGADPAFLRHLPASLQHGLRAHFVLRRWILCHIVDPDLSLFQRQFRMVRALETVELCRSRMANVVFGGQAEVQSRIVDPSLASFVERAVTSAIVSPESRLFSSAWHGVGITRKASAPDTLSVIVQSDLIATEATATLDLAWLQERLVEIATQVDSFTEGVSINFDKRRWLFNTVRNALAITPSQQASSFVGDPLAQMEKQLVGWGTWGVRILRDVASGEGTKLTKAAKPFHRLVAQQQEKSRRDKQTKDYVSKGLKIEQQGRMQREKDAAKGMDKTVNARARRMTSLFRAVRPTSTFVTAQQPPPPQSWPSPGAVQNLREWMPNSKPYLVLALSGVQVQPYDNSQRSFIFELSTEDGQRSLFQASSLDEMRMWISNFQKSGTQIAFRRATFLAQTALAEEDEPTQSQPFQTTTVASKGLFAVPLWEVLQRERSQIPTFVEKALTAIEQRGLHEVGIYRISGENRVIQETKAALNRGVDPTKLVADMDVHNLTGLVKLFLRDMPEPLIPADLYDAFIEANAVADYDQRLYAIRDLVWKMPQPNFFLCRRLSEHLDKITEEEETNAMHAANLSIIFAPTLLKPPPGPASFGLSMTNLGKAANIVKSLILQQHWIFGEEVVEEEAEVIPALVPGPDLVSQRQSTIGEQEDESGSIVSDHPVEADAPAETLYPHDVSTTIEDMAVEDFSGLSLLSTSQPHSTLSDPVVA